MWRAADLGKVLVDLGIKRGDRIYCHASLMHLGRPAENSAVTMRQTVDMLVNLVGAQDGTGSVGMATYTQSYTTGKVFDVAMSQSKVGALTEYFRHEPGVRRTTDPIYSSAFLLPPNSFEWMFGEPRDWNCFGDGSVFEGLHAEGFKILMLGRDMDATCTYVHHMECVCQVPYRFTKTIEGETVKDGKSWLTKASFYARDLTINPRNTFKPLERQLLQSGRLGRVEFGAGEILVGSARDIHQAALEMLTNDPYCLVVA